MQRIEKISTVGDRISPSSAWQLRKWFAEAFSKLWRESQQWDLPECDRTSSHQQR